MNIKKRATSSLLIVIMLFIIANTTVFANNTAVINLSSQTAKAGETVDITVSLSNNPGFVSMLLEVDYDSTVLTLTKVTDKGILGSQSHSDNLTLNPYILYWNNGSASSDYTVNGEIVTLTFAISESAQPGEYPITVSYDENADAIFNFDLEAVHFNVQNGKIAVENNSGNQPYTESKISDHGFYSLCEVNMKNVTENCDVILAAYKGNKFLGMEKRAYTSDRETFLVNSEADSLKIMLWNSLQGIRPLCEAETLTIK